jgi:probable rRNA maturation factor
MGCVTETINGWYNAPGSWQRLAEMKVSVTRQGTRSRIVTTTEIQRAAEVMLRATQQRSSELSVVLCDDETIHTLNRDYRRKNKPTDVLAFAMREGEGAHLAGNLLGDVIISLDTASRQAIEQGVAPRAEVRMLLAHGILHLLGWDHRTETEDRLMREEVARLLLSVERYEKRVKKPRKPSR